MSNNSDFSIGDKVEAVDDIIRGVVVAFDDGKIVMESTDGFRLAFDPTELIRLGNDSLEISPAEAARIRSEEKKRKKKQPSRSSAKDRYAPKMEIDLHIEKLVRDTRGMAKHDLLNLQIDTAQRQLEFAIRKGIQKVVFIHGVGAGTLKEELKYLFNRYEGIRSYEADYQKYGLGATEIYISQKA